MFKFGKELSLAPLSTQDVAAYIAGRLGGAVTPQLALRINERTEGNALFMVNITEHLVQQGLVIRSAGQWTVREEANAQITGLPEGLRQFLMRRIEALAPEIRGVLKATSVMGWSLAMQGNAVAGAAQIRQGLEACQTTGSRLWHPYCLALLAEACGQAAQPETGLQALAEALALIVETNERCWEAEVYRLKGRLLLQLPRPDVRQAEACFRQALDVARHQQAKSLELRAALSLSRLWQQRGKHQAVRDLLAPIYGWFTEGFDTADLQEAKTLLEIG